MQLDNIEGRKFCVVFVKVMDDKAGKVQLQCLRGRASVDRGKVSVISDDGCSFTIPGTSVPNILPSDGTPILKDSEYFCLVKVDPSIQLTTKHEMEIDCDDDECDCGCHEHDHECDCGCHEHDHECDCGCHEHGCH